MAPKINTPYQRGKALKYAVWVTQKDPKNASSVVSWYFLFFFYLRREAKFGSKQKLTTNTKYFTRPFSSNNYKQNHENQHPERLCQYQASNDEDKKAFL